MQDSDHWHKKANPREDHWMDENNRSNCQWVMSMSLDTTEEYLRSVPANSRTTVILAIFSLSSQQLCLFGDA